MHYRSLEHFIADVNRIFDNCRTYKWVWGGEGGVARGVLPLLRSPRTHCSPQPPTPPHPPPPFSSRSQPDTEYVACANKLQTFVKSRLSSLQAAVVATQPAAQGIVTRGVTARGE